MNKMLMDLATNAIAQLSEDLEFVSVNEAGKGLFARLKWAGKDSVPAPIRRALAKCKEEKRKVKMQLRTPTARFELMVLFDEGSNSYLVSLAQKEAGESEQFSLLQHAVQSMVDVLLVMDTTGRITVSNKAAEIALGYSEAQLHKMHIHEVLLELDDNGFIIGGDFANLVKKGSFSGYDAVFRTRKKEELAMLLSGTTITNASGGVVGLVCVAKDISERLELEKQLQEAKESAEQANRAKSLFLANMSHEIRTPMNGVIGMSNLLSTTELSLEQQRYVNRLKLSGDHLLSLINDILDFSKIEAGELTLEIIPFDFADLLDELCELFAQRVVEKNLDFIINVHPTLFKSFAGDPGRLRQILINLIGNSVKFTQVGEIAVRVYPVAEDGDSFDICVEVQDSGVGIPKEKQRSLFSPFTQADESSARKFGGTGLGLSISARLVELMGGKIQVKSTPGQGSLFYFTIPLRCQMSKEVEFEDSLPMLEGRRALLAISSRELRRSLKKQLSWYGFEVVLSRDGAEALFTAEQTSNGSQAFEYIFVDHALTDMSAFELGESLRSVAQGDERLVYIGRESEMVGEERKRALEAGYDAALFKPLGIKEFLRVGVFGDDAAVDQGCEGVSTPTQERKGRILVAEDNIGNQEVIRAMLSKLGHMARIVNNGQEAVDSMIEEPFDLVLMDCQMPVVDGFEATKLIRERTDIKRVPIVAMTANAMKGDREVCLENGMDDYISKPATLDKVAGVINKWLAKEEDSDAATDESKGIDESDSNADESGDEGSVTELPEQAVDSRELDINWETLEGLKGLELEGESMIERMIRNFQGSYQEELAALRSLNEDCREDDLSKAAHKFKSTCGIVGANALVEACQNIETMCNENQYDAARATSLIDEMSEECERVLAALIDFSTKSAA